MVPRRSPYDPQILRNRRTYEDARGLTGAVGRGGRQTTQEAREDRRVASQAQADGTRKEACSRFYVGVETILKLLHEAVGRIEGDLTVECRFFIGELLDGPAAYRTALSGDDVQGAPRLLDERSRPIFRQLAAGAGQDLDEFTGRVDAFRRAVLGPTPPQQAAATVGRESRHRHSRLFSSPLNSPETIRAVGRACRNVRAIATTVDTGRQHYGLEGSHSSASSNQLLAPMTSVERVSPWGDTLSLCPMRTVKE